MIWLATVSAWRWHWLNLNQSGAGELRTEKVGQDRNDARVVAWIQDEDALLAEEVRRRWPGDRSGPRLTVGSNPGRILLGRDAAIHTEIPVVVVVRLQLNRRAQASTANAQQCSSRSQKWPLDIGDWIDAIPFRAQVVDKAHVIADRPAVALWNLPAS